MGQAIPTTACCCSKNCCGEADSEITTNFHRAGVGARPRAPGLPQNFPTLPGSDAPGPCAPPSAAEFKAARYRGDELESMEAGGRVDVVDRRFGAPEETVGRPDAAIRTFGLDQEVEDLSPTSQEFFKAEDPKAVAPLPTPASPTTRDDKIGEHVSVARPPAEVTPEPDPSSQPHFRPPCSVSQQQVRRWQSPHPSPATSRPSRTEEEQLRQTVARHARTGLIYTFGLPGGSKQALDFTGYAENGEALGLDVNKQSPLTVSRIAPGSAAHRLGVQPGWLITHLGDQSFEDQEPSVFYFISKHVIRALQEAKLQVQE